MPDSKIRVAVVFGGRSGEHEVSCLSADSVLATLDRERYEVVPVKITTSGHWLTTPDQQPDTSMVSSICSALDLLRTVDVVFPVLHGPYGEDGTLQATLEHWGIPYIGSGVLASAAGMDKDFTKKLLVAEGLAVTDSVVLRSAYQSVSKRDQERLGLPAFVKPARAGSSLGVSKVESWDRLDAAVAAARAVDTKVLVERGMTGREVDIGVLEYPDGRLAVSPPLEIAVNGARTFFDYDAKYRDTSTIFTVPAELDQPVIARLEECAVRAFEALGCRGLVRVDFFLDGTEPVINEVNTFPGFTAASQYPKMWQAAGLGYGQLLDVLIETAISRPAQRYTDSNRPVRQGA